MTDIILIVLILLAVGAGIFSSIRHFKGKGGCCGGGDYTPKKKKLRHVRYQKTFRVEGMHCVHCKHRVEEAVNDLKGLAGRVDLRRQQLTVLYEEATDDQLIAQKLARLGYTLAEEL